MNTYLICVYAISISMAPFLTKDVKAVKLNEKQLEIVERYSIYSTYDDKYEIDLRNILNGVCYTRDRRVPILRYLKRM